MYIYIYIYQCINQLHQRVAMSKTLNTYKNLEKVQKNNTDDAFSKLEN